MEANRTDFTSTDARQSLGEPRVLISRSALLHNARLLKSRLAPGTKLCAVVKADAYGHGARIVADTLLNIADDAGGPPADCLAVASLDEAIALSASEEMRGSSPPLLVMRPLENAFIGRQRGRIEEAIRSGWSMTLCTPAAADDVARIALASGRRAHVQVAVDTGMTRAGACREHLDVLLQKIDRHPSLRLTGIYTHFTSSENSADPFTVEQLRRFNDATARYVPGMNGPAESAVRSTLMPLERSVIESVNGARVMRHAASSAAVFFKPESHLDMVRPGIALYGVDPTCRAHVDRPLRPVLKWTAPLIGISEIAPGETVGYGRAWTASRTTRVGLVPVGYADGYPRSLSNRAVMMIDGKPAPVIGRVSMDLTTIDLTEIPQVTTGDEVTLLDNDPLSPASVYHLARWAGTIPYEIFCGIGPRVARVAVGDVKEADSDAGLTYTSE